MDILTIEHATHKGEFLNCYKHPKVDYMEIDISEDSECFSLTLNKSDALKLAKFINESLK